MRSLMQGVLTASRLGPSVLVIGGALLLVTSAFVDALLPLSDPGFGRTQFLLATAGALSVVTGGLLLHPASPRWIAQIRPHIPARVVTASAVGVVAVQTALIATVLRWFHIENPAFYEKLMPLIVVGFVVHHVLPLRRRLWCFVLLSITGVWLVFGVGGAWLVGCGLGLIGICHLPIRFGMRVALLLSIGAALAALRGGIVSSPVPAAVWPILGSMFMFRLVLYMYELRHSTEPMGVARSLAYFFMVPNLVFPLFPVVDYATFRRTYYDRNPIGIYQDGVRWMLVGLTHLLVYRFVYQRLTISAAEISNSLELARYMVTNFVLYLKVSGQFHLIVGILHLFGFRLPETHRFFFVASSFTDLWRRINIYWKDFMMKVVYYPAFFRLRRRGEVKGVLLATLAVFAATWLLHSYQWFWLLGSLLLTWPDVLFWTILALLLVGNMLIELKRGRVRAPGRISWSVRHRLVHGGHVMATFATMCILWSLWSSPSVGDWLSIWHQAGIGFRDVGVGVLASAAALLLVCIGMAMIQWWNSRQHSTAALPTFAARSFVYLAWITPLVAIGNPGTAEQLPSGARVVLRDLRVDRLNQHDAMLLHRGYYENLTGVNQFNSGLWQTYANRPTDWQPIWSTPVVRSANGFPGWEVAPLVGLLHNGTTIRTNEWGMRDKDYTREPSNGVLRIAMTGASFVMGQGVNDHETFESLVEDRLNADLGEQTGMAYEILNFAVPNYGPLQQLFQLERRILEFRPRVLVMVAHPYDSRNFARHLAARAIAGQDIPYEYVRMRVEDAGVARGMLHDRAVELLRRSPWKEDILSWTYRRVVALCRESGIEPVWVMASTPDVDVAPTEVQELIELAREAGFAVRDISDALKGVSVDEIRVAPWDAHPNARAHVLLAERLYAGLPELLLPLIPTRGAPITVN